jgi:hypothetical protein
MAVTNSSPASAFSGLIPSKQRANLGNYCPTVWNFLLKAKPRARLFPCFPFRVSPLAHSFRFSRPATVVVVAVKCLCPWWPPRSLLTVSPEDVPGEEPAVVVDPAQEVSQRHRVIRVQHASPGEVLKRIAHVPRASARSGFHGDPAAHLACSERFTSTVEGASERFRLNPILPGS